LSTIVGKSKRSSVKKIVCNEEKSGSVLVTAGGVAGSGVSGWAAI
jgi:hypothetical protein